MVEQKLQKKYNICIEVAAKYILAGIPIEQNLLDIIAELQMSMRNNDILEAMNRIREKGENNAAEFSEPMAAQPTYHMPQSSLQQVSEYLDKMTCPRAAEFNKPMAAQLTYHMSQSNLQQVSEYLDKVTCPRAAEFNKPMYAPNHAEEDHKIK